MAKFIVSTETGTKIVEATTRKTRGGFAMRNRSTRSVLMVVLIVAPAFAGFESGSDGTDGALNCSSLGLVDCSNQCTSENPCHCILPFNEKMGGLLIRILGVF